MKRLLIISFIVFTVITAGIISCAPQDAARPNVVLIIIDTLRADKLGIYGFSGDISPEIDRMADNGLSFMNVTAQSSWTRPSIGSMLTSKYPRSAGLYVEKYDSIHESHITLAEALKAGGYSTFGITANPTINSIFNFDQGFDSYLDSDVVWWWMGNDKGERKLGKKRMKSFDKEDNYIPLADAPYIFNKVLEYARSRSTGPSYVQINVMEVHEYRRLIRPEFSSEFSDIEAENEREYYTSIKQVSHDTGRFVDELTSLPGWENTLFIITSDHGEGLNDHPSVLKSKRHGRVLYGSQLNVPMIWYKTPQPSGITAWISSIFPKRYSLNKERITQRVRLMDLYPTLLDHLGIKKPDDIDGISLISLIKDSSATVSLPDIFVTETYFKESDKIALYSGSWEYIENRDGHNGLERFELQPSGIKEDGRMTDISEENPEIVSEFKNYLRKWEKEHPKAEATSGKERPSEEVLQQLKSLGYMN